MKMKNIKFIVLGFMFVLASCKKEPIQLNVPEAAVYIDSRSLSFTVNFASVMELPEKVILDSTGDVTLVVNIHVTGAPQNFDREYKWAVQDSSTAVVNKDYEFLENKFVVKAGELTARTQIKLKRNADLGAERVSLYLKLIPGKDFMATLDKMEDLVTISFFDQLTAPPYWDWFAYGYLDEYSEKKFRLLQQITDMPADALSTLPETERDYQRLVGQLKLWGIILKRYLEEQDANGNTVYEEDGSPMIWGYYLD